MFKTITSAALALGLTATTAIAGGNTTPNAPTTPPATVFATTLGNQGGPMVQIPGSNFMANVYASYGVTPTDLSTLLGIDSSFIFIREMHLGKTPRN